MSESTNDAAQSIPDIWSLEGEQNPYLHNIFSLLDIDPDQAQKKYAAKLARAKKRVGVSDAEPIVVHGRTVDMTDIAQAEQTAKAAAVFVASRLLVHTRHELETGEFQPLMKQIESAPLPSIDDRLPLPVRSLSVISQYLPEPTDVEPEGESEFPRKRLHEVFLPDPAEEQMFDL